MKHFVAHRGSIVRNALSPHVDENLTSYAKMARRTNIVHNIDFEALSAQTTPHNDNDFKFYSFILNFSSNFVILTYFKEFVS